MRFDDFKRHMNARRPSLPGVRCHRLRRTKLRAPSAAMRKFVIGKQPRRVRYGGTSERTIMGDQR
jgi:hypothetical protein